MTAAEAVAGRGPVRKTPPSRTLRRATAGLFPARWRDGIPASTGLRRRAAGGGRRTSSPRLRGHAGAAQARASARIGAFGHGTTGAGVSLCNAVAVLPRLPGCLRASPPPNWILSGIAAFNDRDSLQSSLAPRRQHRRRVAPATCLCHCCPLLLS